MGKKTTLPQFPGVGQGKFLSVSTPNENKLGILFYFFKKSMNTTHFSWHFKICFLSYVVKTHENTLAIKVVRE